MWANCERLWNAEDEDEDEDDDRHYDSDHYHSDDGEKWRRNCTCDASGPYWCSCRRDDD